MALTFTQATGGPVPNVEIENRVLDGGGLPNANKYRSACFYGELLAAGSGTAGTVYGPLDLEEIKDKMGERSPVHLMAEKFAAFNSPETGRPKGDMYVCGLVEVAGGTAATNRLVLTNPGGLNALGNGTVTYEVGGHQFRVNVRTGDTITQIGDAIVAAYLALPYAQQSPVTPVNAAGTITWTATVKAEHPNTIGTITLVDLDSSIDIVSTWDDATMGGASAPSVAGAGVQNAAAQATALAALAGEDNFAFTVVPWRDVLAGAGVTGSLDEVLEHINTKANANNMISSFMFAGDTIASANLITAASITGLNEQSALRAVYAGLEGTNSWNAEVAVSVAAAVSSEPSMGRSLNGVKCPSLNPPSQSDKFTPTDLRSLLEGGVTPLYAHKGESVVGICRTIVAETSYGVFDLHRMRIADYVRDDLNAQLGSSLSRASIVEDGAVIPNVEYVTSPAAVKALIHSRLKLHEANGLITNVDSLFEKYVGELDVSAGELRAAFPDQAVSQLHNLMIRQDVVY